MVKFNIRDKSSYLKYTEQLDKYLSKYNNITATRICTGQESNAQLFADGSAKAVQLPGDDIIKVIVGADCQCYAMARCAGQHIYSRQLHCLQDACALLLITYF
ncbi:unnamed protein product [Gongylonema pulchrum]|uniref:Uncharacterized protein n=1 Tax=Gongylonema pulchrum TaxID=637853 RepID=A0A3P6SMR3_9BILA|nr:unnamed protein product [Gongylonema pulchrum]